jgi:hypothetical protein
MVCRPQLPGVMMTLSFVLLESTHMITFPRVTLKDNVKLCCLVCGSFDAVGKEQAVKLNAVDIMIPYLYHTEPRIQAFGVAALMRCKPLPFCPSW